MTDITKTYPSPTKTMLKESLDNTSSFERRFSHLVRRKIIRREQDKSLDITNMLLATIKGYLFMAKSLFNQGQTDQAMKYLEHSRKLLNDL